MFSGRKNPIRRIPRFASLVLPLRLSPAVRRNVHERWSVALSGAMPVVQTLNGVQDGMPYRILLGFSAGL
ncbi:MAG TPA: hypothetical protein VF853_08795 [Candidatus Deferrimicrobiaceae bacterium]